MPAEPGSSHHLSTGPRPSLQRGVPGGTHCLTLINPSFRHNGARLPCPCPPPHGARGRPGRPRHGRVGRGSSAGQGGGQGAAGRGAGGLRQERGQQGVQGPATQLMGRKPLILHATLLHPFRAPRRPRSSSRALHPSCVASCTCWLGLWGARGVVNELSPPP